MGLNPGIYAGTPGYGDPGASVPVAVVGSSVGFSGDDRVTVPNSTSLQLVGDASWELWLRPDDFLVRRNPLAKAFAGEGTVTQETDGRLSFYQGDGGGNTAGFEVLRSSPLPVGVWSHVVVTRSGSTLRWFVNGVLDTSKTMTKTPAASSLPLLIGAGYTDGYVGGIDEVAVYGRALSPTEIGEHYATLAAGDPAAYGTVVTDDSPVSYWRLDDLGSPAVDAMGLNPGIYAGTPGYGEPGASVNLTKAMKVLLITAGDGPEQQGLNQLMTDLLDQVETPYDVLDSTMETLTPATLITGSQGNYNGIILTSADLYVSPSVSGFTLEEWQLLHAYERIFQVRESVVSGFPAFNPSLDLDYGMATVGNGTGADVAWVGAAGGTELFEYVNTTATLPITDFALWAVARNDGTGPTVEPLLVDSADPTHVFVSRLVYPDGREVLLSTISNAWYLTHSQVLAYEFLNFATSGVFIGARHVYLSTHVDDLFLADPLWDPVANKTWFYFEEPYEEWRMTGAEYDNAVAAQAAFRAAHPTAADFKLDWAFNGEGADTPSSPLWDGFQDDSLTLAVINNPNAFRYINHTLTHLDMDVSAGFVGPSTQSVARYEIQQNRVVWDELGLPDRVNNDPVLISGDHSGLRDDMNTDYDPTDDLPYPGAKNDDFLQAAVDEGIRYLAGDSSQANQNVEHYVPDFPDLLLLPRYPATVYFNTTTPALLLDEYNYIFYERFIDLGLDPCVIPGAICTPVASYAELVAIESQNTLRHLLGYKSWAHYFHQSNLFDYDGSGSTLMFDWLEASVSAYEDVFDLPILNLPYYELGLDTKERLAASAAGVTGILDVGGTTVTLNAGADAVAWVTGLDGTTADYGGQSLQKQTVSTTPTVVTIDRATDR
ncbi:MAG: LamG domain-containing protein [Acidimicrobiia bacterium]|nr:LamG domain-containing protein [Acidimicrobiia bacterium]